MFYKRELKILLIGGNFVGKGAEAMMLTIKDTIKEVAPNSLIYAVPVYDEEVIQLIRHGFIPLKKKNLIWIKRIFLLIKTLLSPKRKLKSNLERLNESGGLSNIFSVSDVVIDISGFASGDQWGWRVALNRAINFITAKYSGNTIVFMPQSWGTFKSFSIRYLTNVLLKTAKYVFAREYLSYNYLLEHKCVIPEKLFYATDIAFHFEADTADKAEYVLNNMGVISLNKTPLVAITPNIRIYQRTQGEGINNTYVKQLFEVIDYFLTNTDSNILLIPHEFFKEVNDLILCKLIMDHYSNDERIFVTHEKLSAGEVKAIIGLCDLVIASRYHSLVAALSMGVVPVVIGWSHKYDELIKLFELEKLVTDPVNQVQFKVIEVVEDAWKNRMKYMDIINRNKPEIEKSSSVAIEKLKEVLKNISMD